MVPGHWERHLHVSAVVSSGRVQIQRSSIMQELMTWTKATHAICMHCTRDLFRLVEKKAMQVVLYTQTVLKLLARYHLWVLSQHAHCKHG